MQRRVDIYSGHVLSARDPLLARRLPGGPAPLEETRVTIAPPFFALRPEANNKKDFTCTTNGLTPGVGRVVVGAACCSVWMPCAKKTRREKASRPTAAACLHGLTADVLIGVPRDRIMAIPVA